MDKRKQRKEPEGIYVGEVRLRKKISVEQTTSGTSVVNLRGTLGGIVLDRREAREVRDFLNHFIEWDAQGHEEPTG